MAAIKKYAVVTGSNKGIGFEICKQLASYGVVVVLTARDEKKGLEALEKLKVSGLSDNVVFHPLDVVNPSSIASLVDFVKNQFGRLDILVNNAGVDGAIVDGNALRAARSSGAQINWNEIMSQPYDLAVQCLETNYHAVKRVTEAFIPLLQLSDSPRIVNVTSLGGQLQYMSNEWAKGILDDVENLTEEKIDEVLNQFLKDFKEGTLAEKGWTTRYASYMVSKAALNAYTRIAANKYPNICINCVHPGFTATDLNFYTGILKAEEGASHVVQVAVQPDGSPSGLFYAEKVVASY